MLGTLNLTKSNTKFLLLQHDNSNILNSSFTSNGTSHSFVAKSDLITFPVNKCLDATWLMKFAAIRNSGPSGILALDRFVLGTTQTLKWLRKK